MQIHSWENYFLYLRRTGVLLKTDSPNHKILWNIFYSSSTTNLQYEKKK